MKILYIGGGYVGACSAAVSADSGHDVLVYDNDRAKVDSFSSLDKERIEACLFEEGLGELIIRNRARLRFTHDYGEVESFLDETGAVFMCLPTPEKDGSGETDLSIYEAATNELGRAMAARHAGRQSNYILIVNKSTVPIKMVDRTSEILGKHGVTNYGVGSNPEFLVEGKAVEGSIRPPRIVVGAWNNGDFAIFRDIYSRYSDNPKIAYIEVNPIEAAAGKLMANYMLFNRLANCFDVMGRACEKFPDMRFEKVRKVVTTDKRIGDWGFYDSLYAGGSCFIKDARSLAYQLKERSAVTDLINDTLEANIRQIDNFLNRPESELGFDWTGKRVALIGLAFKQDTNDIRNSGALIATEFLLDKGVEQIWCYDPVAGDNYLDYFAKHPKAGKLELSDSEESAIDGADVLLIATDWPQFRGLGNVAMSKMPAGGLIMDGRRMLAHKYAELAEAGFKVVAVGSPAVIHNR